MKTVRLVGNELKIQDFNFNNMCCNAKGALIKVIGCGLCGSDISKIKNVSQASNYFLGHEVVGEIVELNSDINNFKVGDIVVAAHHVPCFKCIYCKHENYSMCEEFKKSNIIPGGFSEFVYLSENHLKNTVFIKPQNLSVIEASFMEPLACCIRAIKRARLLKNDKTLVVGLGSIGYLMSQALVSYDMSVIGVDLICERVDNLKKININGLVFENNDITSNKIRQLTDGYGVDCVFMTSGARSALDFALKSVRNGGKIVVFSSINDKDLGYELYIGLNVQEEVGVRGAQTMAQKIKPDLAIVVDCSPANDLINKNELGQIGEGLLIRVVDRSMIGFFQLIDWQRNICKKHHIKYQHFISNGGTDAGIIHKSNSGILTLTSCLCARNIHSNSSILDMEDYYANLKFLYFALKDINRKTYQKLLEANR